MSKEVLRKQFKQERLRLPMREVQAYSNDITQRLKHLLEWRYIKTLHCFTSIPELHEVETAKFFSFLWQKYPNVQTYSTLLVGKEWKIGKVIDGVFAELRGRMPDFDVIIVPMLGFDETLHRLGYGGGYYDQFLATQPQAQKIGLCFELGRVDKLPTEPHDMVLGAIVTEQQIYRSDPTPY